MYLIVKISENGMVHEQEFCDTIEDAQIEFNEWENEMMENYEEDDIHISKDRMNGCVWLYEEDDDGNHELFAGDFQECIMIIEQ
jgi:hypothetical protein